MAGDDLINFDGNFQAQISALIGDLNRMTRDVDTEAASAANEAAEIIAKEQRRLFSKADFKRTKKGHRYKYADNGLIKIFRDKKASGKVYKLRVGYDTETLRQYPELIVIEFGRPGKSPRHSSKVMWNSKFRKNVKKGNFPPHVSHIRAGFELSKEDAAKRFEERLFEIVKRDFNGGGN